MECKGRVVKWLSQRGITPEPFKLHVRVDRSLPYAIGEGMGGRPSIVNPLLANPSRRKTDVLDAKLLSYQAITNNVAGELPANRAQS